MIAQLHFKEEFGKNLKIVDPVFILILKGIVLIYFRYVRIKL